MKISINLLLSQVAAEESESFAVIINKDKQTSSKIRPIIYNEEDFENLM